MSQRTPQDVDRLVELITRRVEAELGKLRGSAPAATGEGRSCGACPARGQCDARAVTGAIDAGATRISATAGVDAPPCSHVAPLIDHTLLKPEATRDELRQVSEEAKRYGFATVCVNSANVRFVAQILDGSGVKPIAVVGFPTGAATASAKAYETREAVRNGAKEIDMVLNIGALKSKDYALVHADIAAVVDAAGKVPVKVILETSKLERDEKVIACAVSKAAGAAFVKTSTGFGGGGATAEDIALMRAIVGEDMGVKASGGVRSFEDAEAMVRAGANRIGTSSSIAIVKCEKPAAGAKKSY
jgi:deoxyribose-phosphate aldolase